MIIMVVIHDIENGESELHDLQFGDDVLSQAGSYSV
jgi:hypothetical protein